MIGVLTRLKPRVPRDSLRGRRIADAQTSGTEGPA